MRFFKRRRYVGYITDAESDGVGIEMLIRKAQCFGILRRPDERIDAARHRPVHADVEHIFVDIRHRHLRTGLRHAKRNVAGTTRHVENVLAFARFYPAHELVLPEPVHAARHCIVHDVIIARDIGKDPAYARCLFFRANLFIAKRYRISHCSVPSR